MTAEILHVVACVANPLRWQSRITLARAAIGDWLKSRTSTSRSLNAPMGAAATSLADLAGDAASRMSRCARRRWRGRRNACSTSRSPAYLPAAEKIATFDADVDLPPRRLDDRGAGGSRPLSSHPTLVHGLRPRASRRAYPDPQELRLAFGMPASRSSRRAISSGSSTAVTQCIRIPATHGHGRVATLDRIGGLFELAGMGSGDHHMALGMVGAADASMPGGVERRLSRRREGLGVAHASRKSTASSALPTAQSSICSTAARTTAATSRAGRCSSTMASTRIRISSATPMA